MQCGRSISKIIFIKDFFSAFKNDLESGPITENFIGKMSSKVNEVYRIT